MVADEDDDDEYCNDCILLTSSSLQELSPYTCAFASSHPTSPLELNPVKMKITNVDMKNTILVETK